MKISATPQTEIRQVYKLFRLLYPFEEIIKILYMVLIRRELKLFRFSLTQI